MLSEFCIRHKLGEEALGKLTKLVDDTIVRIGRCLISAPLGVKNLKEDVNEGEPCRLYALNGKKHCKSHVDKEQPVAKEPVKESVGTSRDVLLRGAVTAAMVAAATRDTSRSTLKGAVTAADVKETVKEPPPPPPVPAHLKGGASTQSDVEMLALAEELGADLSMKKKTIKRPIAWMKKQQQKMVVT